MNRGKKVVHFHHLWDGYIYYWLLMTQTCTQTYIFFHVVFIGNISWFLLMRPVSSAPCESPPTASKRVSPANHSFTPTAGQLWFQMLGFWGFFSLFNPSFPS